MADYALAIAAALAAWWIGTAVVLYLDRLPRSTYRYSIAGLSLAAAAALALLNRSSADATPGGAYVAFTAALVVWAWVEASFLMGLVTGPRRTACPPGSRGVLRAWYALQAIAYHEAALLLAGIAVLAVTFDGANRVGAATFAVLYAMRQSAKLNVFLGVRNLSEELLPPHLRYLASYFRRRPMNALFPVSVAVGTIVTVALWQQAADAEGNPFAVAANALLGSLMALAVLEHWLLVVPLPVHAMWQWTVPSQRPE